MEDGHHRHIHPCHGINDINPVGPTEDSVLVLQDHHVGQVELVSSEVSAVGRPTRPESVHPCGDVGGRIVDHRHDTDPIVRCTQRMGKRRGKRR